MLVTPVYIICSASPQVGKTLIARLLSEFLLLKNGTVLSFDINLKEPSLLDYLPAITETADVMDTYGKMQLVDRLILNDGVAKVIDLGFHAFDEFFKMCGEIDFVSEAILHNVVPIIMFVADLDRVSARAHEMLRWQVPPRILITVHNEFVVRGELFETMGRGRLLRFAALPVFLSTYIRRFGLSFTGYLRHEKDSSTELHQWIRRSYTVFRDLELSVIPQCSF
ncbi:hypothetical protein [Bradyrhizobium sp. CCGB20]|uniref:hypothetical protein n=1 Tax=Bradyrhizobium sp. CCGB20 TaxID=2949633 RepID=UPI0020B373CF|nr:hypothetical protein [Bradyrhizobium sp. CCGB20]MCP3396989.1 hypothetical protein [Bradyrhizobium sp. CCGB20]